MKKPVCKPMMNLLLRFGLVFFLTGITVAQIPSPTPSLSDILAGFVQEGKVDYEGLRASKKTDLQKFVKSLATSTPETMEKSKQIAFWLDAYNGLVIHQIVETGRQPATARERGKFFRGTRYKIAGQSRTLDQIEHEALLPLAADPRIHFLLVCGASSCPPLKPESFLQSDSLERELEAAAKAFVNDPKNVSIDPATKTLTLSRIFDWYKDDFGNVLAFVSRYRSNSEKAVLNDGKWTLRYFEYDWSLNASKASPAEQP